MSGVIYSEREIAAAFNRQLQASIHLATQKAELSLHQLITTSTEQLNNHRDYLQWKSFYHAARQGKRCALPQSRADKLTEAMQASHEQLADRISKLEKLFDSKKINREPVVTPTPFSLRLIPGRLPIDMLNQHFSAKKEIALGEHTLPKMTLFAKITGFLKTLIQKILKFLTFKHGNNVFASRLTASTSHRIS